MKCLNIYKAAVRRDAPEVRRLLAENVKYRDAQLYIEGFHKDTEASLFVFHQAHCACGNPAVRWNPEPKCGSCGFSEAMDCIEFN